MIKGLKKLLDRSPVRPVEAARPAISVLMVCMGNICRSPTAEAVLRQKLVAAGLDRTVRVDSAGTHGYHTGEAPDPRAIRRGAVRGYELAAIRARPFQPLDYLHHAWILAMDQTKLEWLKRKAPPDSVGRIELLLGYGRRHPDERDVPDPYYGAPAGFDRVLDLVEDACEGVVERLKADAHASRQDGLSKG